jgi:hypothetical protein
MDRRKFEALVEERIAGWAERAGRLQYHASIADTVTDNRYFRQIGLVAEGCATVAALLKELANAPIAEWQHGREGIGKAMSEVERSFEALETALAANAKTRNA